MEKDYQEQLLEIRKEIDAIDEQLLPLFLSRMQCSERVAAVKKAAGLPVLNAKREQEILDAVRQKAGDLGPEAASLFSFIMEVSRSRQHTLLGDGGEIALWEHTAARAMPETPAGVVCQGVEGAYSHHAALSFFGEAPLTFVPAFSDVFEAVERGEGQFGVLPVENSAAGSVTAVYDLILKYRFFIVGAVAVKVEHCLAVADPAQPIHTVVSHPQALSQCSDIIHTRGWDAREFSNTATAARYVAEERPGGVAVLCSTDAAEKYGLTILEEGVQNDKNNRTRFVIIAKEPVFPEQANKISLCFSLPHRPGSLNSVLHRFAMCGLNMTKIESRPIPGRNFEYDFYLDFTGNIHEKATLDLICSLHDELPRFSFLGNYSEDN